MKTFASLLIALILALASCTTTTPMALQEDIPSTAQLTSQPDIVEDSNEADTANENTKVEELEEIETTEPSEPIENATDDKPLIEPGTAGQAGGVVFTYEGANLEEFVVDTDGMSYEEALTISQNCTMITKNESYSGWRLPSVDELLAIYSQLFETGLVEFEETYYWAASTKDSDTAPVVYFGTGFETDFYKDMDFVGLIVVRDI
mgnify:FL=1